MPSDERKTKQQLILELREARKRLADMDRELDALAAERTAELARSKEELEAACGRLMQLDKMKSALLSSVSHELRTPLTSVRGFAGLIAKEFTRAFLPLAEKGLADPRKAERILDNLRIIEQEGGRLTRLVHDVLDVSRIEAGRMEWNDRRVDTGQVLRNAAEAMAGVFAQRPELELRLDLDRGLPTLVADPDRLAQVCINLLDNAAKFTESGLVVLLARAEGDFLRIEVRDTGRGIAPWDIERIFDKFHQASRSDALERKPIGAGLGLCISRQIVEHYGGRIWATSTKGAGSAFTVLLPAAPEPGEIR